jgi:hypothetical protein
MLHFENAGQNAQIFPEKLRFPQRISSAQEGRVRRT